MSLVVEDGTGLSNATSLCSVADADAYWAARDTAGAWSQAGVPDKELALSRASDYVRNQTRYVWYGTKKTYAQTMPWPRTGASERYGQAIPDTVVPFQVKEAVAFLANTALSADLQPTLERGGGIQSEKIGELSTSFFEGSRADDAIQFVDGILATLCRDVKQPLATPFYEEPVTDPSFETGAFNNGSADGDQ